MSWNLCSHSHFQIYFVSMRHFKLWSQRTGRAATFFRLSCQFSFVFFFYFVVGLNFFSVMSMVEHMEVVQPHCSRKAYSFQNSNRIKWSLKSPLSLLPLSHDSLRTILLSFTPQTHTRIAPKRFQEYFSYNVIKRKFITVSTLFQIEWTSTISSFKCIKNFFLSIFIKMKTIVFKHKMHAHSFNFDRPTAPINVEIFIHLFLFSLPFRPIQSFLLFSSVFNLTMIDTTIVTLLTRLCVESELDFVVFSRMTR